MNCILYSFSWYFKSISINFNVFQWVYDTNVYGSMRTIEQDQPPFYYSSESELELITADGLQLPLHKTL